MCPRPSGQIKPWCEPLVRGKEAPAVEAEPRICQLCAKPRDTQRGSSDHTKAPGLRLWQISCSLVRPSDGTARPMQTSVVRAAELRLSFLIANAILNWLSPCADRKPVTCRGHFFPHVDHLRGRKWQNKLFSFSRLPLCYCVLGMRGNTKRLLYNCVLTQHSMCHTRHVCAQGCSCSNATGENPLVRHTGTWNTIWVCMCEKRHWGHMGGE